MKPRPHRKPRQYRQPRMDVKPREARRMEAVRRRRAGESAGAVAARLGVAVHTVYAWGKAAREGGKKALQAVPKSGRPLKLDRAHWASLKRMILKGPRGNDFDRDLWTLPMIQEPIERAFGVTYHDDHLSTFVRRLGRSVQKPMVRAKERDERAIQRFVEVEFPALEKNEAPRRHDDLRGRGGILHPAAARDDVGRGGKNAGGEDRRARREEDQRGGGADRLAGRGGVVGAGAGASGRSSGCTSATSTARPAPRSCGRCSAAGAGR